MSSSSAPKVSKAGVDYSAVSSTIIEDARWKKPAQETPAMTSTLEALIRMEAGVDGRTIADKIANPNRPTWETYKKENEDKLDLYGGEARKMVEYRLQLDRERESRLAGASKRLKSAAISDSSDDDSSDSESSSAKKKRKSKKEKKKKHKKDKKRKKDKKKKTKTEAKKLKEACEGSQSPVPLSQMLNQSSSSDDYDDSSEDR